jgi:hypothetical protein
LNIFLDSVTLVRYERRILPQLNLLPRGGPPRAGARFAARKTWMAGTSPAMTVRQ